MIITSFKTTLISSTLPAITEILTTCLALSYGISQKCGFFDLENIENKYYLGTDSFSLHLAERRTISAQDATQTMQHR